MPRPKTIPDADVLAAAARVVGRDGPGGLTFAAVGAECGLSPATILQRFGSKRGLQLALAAHGRDDLPALFREAAEREPSPHDAIVEALCALARGVKTPGELANHLAFLQLDLADPELHALAREHARGMQRELTALVEAAIAAGELAAADPAAAARALHVTYNGSLVSWAIDPDGPLEARLRTDVNATLEGWRADAS
jgi:AcrR family transcriptional regulator